ncbi:inositol-pentakisphosphate 2-kinase [Lasiosphaeria miniovina]|uniref:Inositol-pentakisphosphate 2-kinase n=1 Tax=Lasiosphaeria miniovina TaxID=1954250 RepID=A0AA40DZM1_9PEZI|nr:inositol-pentakisphosphate 2-kinase [Lasiosphaeria miniovina]KAK0722464.1 inositol-pentakisphosphate 2-kinase [Lasiosphaeria miniovina]
MLPDSTTEPTSASDAIPDLSVLLAAWGGYHFKFVGEGAANLVFDIIPVHTDGDSNANDPSEDILKGHLLRVPKAGTQAYKHDELQAYWETAVQPLFEPRDLVQQRLVRLGGAGGGLVAARLNAALRTDEDGRRGDFQGSQVAAAEYGMLVEDMRKKSHSDLIVEFKPKWLSQSPNAPVSATRCRNCAREAYRRNHFHRKKKQQTSTAGPPTTITTTGTSSSSSTHETTPLILCPLDFLACTSSTSSNEALDRLVDQLITGASPHGQQHQQHHSRLKTWLATNSLLARLRDAQLANDRCGPLGASAPNGELQLAMTLRDCTCFVRVSGEGEDEDGRVEAKIADLDKKNGEAKMGYWQETERQLIDGGYYDGTEEPRQVTNCQVERSGTKVTKDD